MIAGTFENLSDLIDAILAPIANGPACGPDLRENNSPQSLYYRLRDARSEARIVERRLESEAEPTDSSSGHWREVITLAAEALSVQTKDIEIASWLTEALARRSGLAGFTAGIRVLTGLVQSFWATGLHPPPDEIDRWATFTPIAGLSGEDRDGTLIQPLRNTTILTLADGVPVTLWSYHYARDLSALSAEKLKAVRVPDRLPRFQDIELFAQGAGRQQLATAAHEAAAGLDAWKELDAAVAATGAPPTPTSRIETVLQDIRTVTRRYVKEEPVMSVEAPAIGFVPETDPGSATGPARVVSFSPRDELLDRVLNIAATFRTREPNSPFSFTLEEAVRRARLPLTSLLEELVPDERSRAAILSSLGLRIEGKYSLAAVQAEPTVGPGGSAHVAAVPHRNQPASETASEANATAENDDLGF